MEKRVGILGGSFDPVHCGHVRIARSFLKSGLINQLLVTLTPYPPHKKDEEQASFTHRFEMLKLAFEDMENVIISDLEQTLEKPSYTLQTIEYLQENNPDNLFYLCFGQDSLQQFDKWHKYREILKKVNLMVAERPGVDNSQIDPEILERTIFIEHQPYAVSSTAIRLKNGDFKNDLPDGVATYIDKHNLYR